MLPTIKLYPGLGAQSAHYFIRSCLSHTTTVQQKIPSQIRARCSDQALDEERY